MSWVANQLIHIEGKAYGPGEALSDDIPDDTIEILHLRGYIAPHGDAPEASGGTPETTSEAQANGGTPSTTLSSDDAQAVSDGSSSSDEYPKRTTPDSSWYELSNGKKVQGYDQALEEEQALQD